MDLHCKAQTISAMERGHRHHTTTQRDYSRVNYRRESEGVKSRFCAVRENLSQGMRVRQERDVRRRQISENKLNLQKWIEMNPGLGKR
jgi:hypothetical protein